MLFFSERCLPFTWSLVLTAIGAWPGTSQARIETTQVHPPTAIQKEAFDHWVNLQNRIALGRLLRQINVKEAQLLAKNFPPHDSEAAPIFPPEALQGTVIAAPWDGQEIWKDSSGHEHQSSFHNYRRNWTRDAALTYYVIMDRLEMSRPGTGRETLTSILKAYADFTTSNQRTLIEFKTFADTVSTLRAEVKSEPSWLEFLRVIDTKITTNPVLAPFHDQIIATLKSQPEFRCTGLGAAWTHLNGMPNLKSWGDPQNDGPALRAQVLMRFARFLLEHGAEKERKLVLDSILPAIRTDLEYTSAKFEEKDFDIWEMKLGHHLFNRVTKMDALTDAAQFYRDFSSALGLGNTESLSSTYQKQATSLSEALSTHWSEKDHALQATVGRDEASGTPYSLDSAVILAALTRRSNTGQFSVTDPKILSTAIKIKALSAKYPVNDPARKLPGIAIMRHEGDGFWGGNPWFISTAAFGELAFRIAQTIATAREVNIDPEALGYFSDILVDPRDQEELKSASQNRRTLVDGDPLFKKLLQALMQEGDSYAKRIQIHAGEDGSLSEQMDSGSGTMKAATNLTWSYAAYLRLFRARRVALQSMTPQAPCRRALIGQSQLSPSRRINTSSGVLH